MKNVQPNNKFSKIRVGQQLP